MEYFLFLHPTDCLVIEESPITAVLGLDVDDIVSFVHRAPCMYHHRFQEVMGACFFVLWMTVISEGPRLLDMSCCCLFFVLSETLC